MASFVWVVFTSAGRGAEQDTALVAIAIKEETAKLNLRPRAIELPSEKALHVRDAIKHGEYATARQIIVDILGHSQIQNWRFYPFEDFVKGISDLNDPTFEEKLTDWVNQNKGDDIPALIRAQYYMDVGWFVRGLGFRQQTQVGHLSTFQNYLESFRKV